MQQSSVPTLRERSRQRARQEVLQAALELFATRGYRDTTVEDIAAAAALSPRTVFRLFRSKDDIVAASWDAFGEQLASTFRDCLDRQSLPAALRSTLQNMVRFIDDPDDRQRADVLRKISEQHPAVGASYLQRQAAWQRTLTRIAHERYPEVADTDPRLDAVVGAAFAALQAAERAWRTDGNTSTFAELLPIALDATTLHPFR